ncbi:MAG: permease [Pirellulaceae bacterium]|nr:permease [Pirellulaceae bacterium]
MTKTRYQWAAPGDVNAFFGLMLDNVANLLLTVSLLAIVFEFPTSFALQHMVPGTALGVLVGDLLFFWMAFRLARRIGSRTVTAMPLGLDTPSTFGMVFFVLGPAFVHAKETLPVEQAAIYTWHIGICAIFVSGLFKCVCAFGSNWIRRVVPRAGLLGSLSAIALVIIAFLPLMEIVAYPVAGMAALAIILTSLIAQVRFPFRIPGALAALLVGGGIYYLMAAMGWVKLPAQEIDPIEALLPYQWFTVFRFEWITAMNDCFQYLPIVLPFALATVVGGIDCTESAAAVGDEYDTGQVIGVEALATLVAALCGGVIQTTPYIGHPAYKAMGGRAAYSLATALFVGSAGLLGYFGFLYVIIPKAAIFPILVFIGLEITAQSFLATPRKHYAAIAIACLPAMAYLVHILAGQVLADPAVNPETLSAKTQDTLLNIRMLSNGFIVTSLIWASALAATIDRRLALAALYYLVAGTCTLFGLIHSPLKSNATFLFPHKLPSVFAEKVIFLAAGYLVMAVILGFWYLLEQRHPSPAYAVEEPVDTD